jgi:hypothetical protein
MGIFGIFLCGNLNWEVHMAMRYTRDFILQVRELLERNLDVLEIAHRLHIDPSDIVAITEIIKQIVS